MLTAPLTSAPSTGMKATAIVAGMVLLGVGQAGALDRNWLAKLSGVSLLGLGIYWLFTPTETTP